MLNYPAGKVEDAQDLDVFADADTVVTRTVAGGGCGGRKSTASGSEAGNRRGGKGKSGGDFQSIFAESLGAGASALGESIDDGAVDADDADGAGDDDDMGMRVATCGSLTP